ncbi:MAG: DUF6361 family protein [Pirellulaceae bacterium]
MQQSFIGWVDLSEDDTRKATEFLKSLNEGTVDELGLGRIRDAISERLFPGTSTTMDYARYLVMIPAIFRDAWDTGTADTDKLENELRRFLKNTMKAEETTTWRELEINSKPSAENWSALRKLGILKGDCSKSFYRNEIKRQKANAENHGDESKSSNELPEKLEWDHEVEVAVKGSDFCQKGKEWWKKGTLSKEFTVGQRAFDLTRSEAKYLLNKYTSAEDISKKKTGDRIRFSDSLMSFNLKNAQAIAKEQNFPWEWPKPPELKSLLTQAKKFSCFSAILTTSYWHFLLMKKDRSRSEARDLLEINWQNAQKLLKDWACTREFESVLSRSKIKTSQLKSDIRFLQSCLTVFHAAKSGQAFLENIEAIIQRREGHLRNGKAKLAENTKLLDSWEVPKGAIADLQKHFVLFDFRSRVARRIVNDILKGLN